MTLGKIYTYIVWQEHVVALIVQQNNEIPRRGFIFAMLMCTHLGGSVYAGVIAITQFPVGNATLLLRFVFTE